MIQQIFTLSIICHFKTLKLLLLMFHSFSLFPASNHVVKLSAIVSKNSFLTCPFHTQCNSSSWCMGSWEGEETRVQCSLLWLCNYFTAVSV